MIIITYTDNDSERLDVFLTDQINDLSRSVIQKMIKDKDVLVNDMVKKANYRLEENDVITVVMPKYEELKVKPIDLKINVIYEDEFLAIIDKPAGIVVYPGDGKEDVSLVAALMGMKMRLSTPKDKHFRNGIVHRLDKDTSGLMIIAKDNATHKMLSEMLTKREVTRKYYALVSGVVEHDFGTIDAPIGRSENNRTIRSVIGSGRPATTYFKVIKRFDNFSFIECELTTGRTHQIRVHLQYIKHPILADPIYGSPNSFHLKNLMLQSYYLKFKHPHTKTVMEFVIDVRDDFKLLMSEWS